MNRRGFLKALGFMVATPVVAKVLPSALIGSPPEPMVATVGSYADYISFSDTAFGVGIDPILLTFQKEMNYRLALTLDTLCAMTSNSMISTGIDFQPVLEMKHYATLHSSDPVGLAA